MDKMSHVENVLLPCTLPSSLYFVLKYFWFCYFGFEKKSYLSLNSFIHGLEAQSLMLVSQNSPTKPSLHSHSNLLSRSKHFAVPVGSQRLVAHSSIAASHVKPA